MDDAHGTEPQEDRLSRLSAASLHTNESLDIDAALQAEMSSVRFLTGAAAVTLNDAAQVDDPLVLDIDTADVERLQQASQGEAFFDARTGGWRISAR